MDVLQMEADILEVMFDLSMAYPTEKIFSVNLAVSILPFIIRKGKAMKFDNMLKRKMFLIIL